jgi:hypothetical protein
LIDVGRVGGQQAPDLVAFDDLTLQEQANHGIESRAMLSEHTRRRTACLGHQPLDFEIDLA